MSAVADQEKKVAVKEGPASVAGTDYMAFLNSDKAKKKEPEKKGFLGGIAPAILQAAGGQVATAE